MTDLEERIVALEAKEAAAGLLTRYLYSLDTGRWSDLEALFCEEAMLEMINIPDYGRETRLEGRTAVMGFYGGRGRGTYPHFRHYAANVGVQLGGPSEAFVSAYWLAISDVDEAAHGISGGLYEDTYVNEGGNWLIKTKRIVRTWTWKLPKSRDWAHHPASEGSSRDGRPFVDEFVGRDELPG